MKYGFIIDNRKCIGCHACTTACKSEHQVPVGVNRTWVKQVEKGAFPDTRRLFSVMRCNHCTDAPCVEICPVEALYTREDGIVDFDNDRCIGCKSCMQACPYDALYIDPENHTAAKCNYCAHRIDIGLEPACVNVCPEHAIISGDMDNPDTEISQLLARQAVKVRKPEKGTQPNLFYIDADDVSLIPSQTEKSDQYFWSSQALGVGHFAKEAEKLAFSNGDVLEQVKAMQAAEERVPKTVEIVMDSTKRTYDTPDKGILWGWEVSAYVWTKAISAGTFLTTFLAWVLGYIDTDHVSLPISVGAGLIFLMLTGLFLVMDLDRPDRFLNVLLRPQWNSWLVRGGYAITIYGGLLSLLGLALWFSWSGLVVPVMWLTAIIAALVAVYTAYLFAQAKGRDFWQSPTLAIHMLVHAVMAGGAVLLLATNIFPSSDQWISFLTMTISIALGVNLVTMLFELSTTHSSLDAEKTVHMIVKGRYKSKFWIGVVLVGNILPIIALTFSLDLIGSLAAALILFGIYMTEHIWIEAPQRIPLH